MSNIAVQWATSLTIHPAPKRVLKALAVYHNDQTGTCAPLQRQLMADTGLSKRSIVRNIAWLVANDLITRKRGRRVGYQLAFDDAPPKKAGAGSALEEIRP